MLLVRVHFVSDDSTVSGDGVEETLTAFLAFRESDMMQWRRAGMMTGLTHSAMLALATTLRADMKGAPLRQVDLRNILHLSPAGTSAIIDELEARELVERTYDPRDRRSNLLRAGASAVPFVEKLSRVDAGFREHVQRLTADQRAAVIGVLDYMREVGDTDYN